MATSVPRPCSADQNDLYGALADFTHALRIAVASLGEGADSHVVWELAGVAKIIRLCGDISVVSLIFHDELANGTRANEV